MILLSIIIPTIGRKSKLVELLQSIFSMNNLSYDFEVIIIDQNPPCYLDETLKDFINYKNINIYKPLKIGLSHAKNYGSGLANGDFITFPDDDCTVFSDTYELAINKIVTLKLDIISGKCIDEYGNDSVSKFKNNEYFLNSKTIDGGFIEATSVISKKILTKYKYDENLGAGAFFGAHEGFDWLFRILKKENYNIYYSNFILFYHPQVILDKGNYSSLKRINTYTYGFVYSRLKNGLYLEVFIRICKVFLILFYYLISNSKKTRYYFVELNSLFIGILFYNSLKR